MVKKEYKSNAEFYFDMARKMEKERCQYLRTQFEGFAKEELKKEFPDLDVESLTFNWNETGIVSDPIVLMNQGTVIPEDQIDKWEKLFMKEEKKDD